jgi:GGDEF domain-containing protein
VSLPPLPDGATLDALPPLPEGATLDAPENTDPASRDVAPSVTGFTAEDVSADVQAADRTARHTRLRLAFDESRRTSEDDAATTLAVAKQLGVPFDNVRKNLPAFKETAAAAQFDPARWEQENPELSKLVLSTPELGPLVLRSKEIGPIVRAFRAAGDWTKDALRAVNEALTVPADTLAEQQAQMQSSDFAAVDPSKLEQANTPLTPEQVADVERQRAQRDAPKLAQEREDPKARLVREDTSFSGRLLLLGLRAAETKQSLDLARKQVRLMLAENGIAGDPAELAAELHDAKLASTPRSYGDDTGLLRDLTEGLQGAVSTVDVGADALKGAGVAGAVGFVATAVPTAVVTKNPGAAVRAGVAGARALAGKGAQTAAFLSAMELETGTSYEALRELTTDAGQKLTPGEAMGGAVVQGLIKGGLEFVSFGQQTKVLKQALPSQITGLITKDPTFRALLRRVATEYGKSVATEGITEGLQDAVEQIGDFVQASMKDEALQKQAYDPTRGLEATQGGVLGALLSGGVTSGLALATTRTTDARTEVADQQVAPLLELAQQPTVKAAPEAFAQLIAETSAEGGHAPLTALHVDAHAVVKYFQEQGFDGQATNAAVAELLGPDAPAKLLDAAATGGKLEVPVEAVLSKWGTSEAGKALVDDTTTDPSALTPRQRAEQKAEIEARAEAIAKEEEAKASEAELLANRTRELEQQLIDAGQSKQAAKASAALVRAFSATMAADFNQALSAVFPEAPLAVAKGDEQAVGDAALAQLPTDALQARAETIDVPTRAAELFTDTVSGLRTRRAWDESPRRPGTQVAVITSPDIKALNDHPTGGHDTANELLRLIGGVLGGVDAEAARSGTNFLLHAKNREELRAAVNAVRAALPAGLTVEGAVAPDIDAAFAKLDSTTAEKRAAGKLPGRGATAFDLSQLGPETFSAGKPATPNVSQALLERAARTQGKDFAREAYFDKDVPGVLSKTGFDALGERAWVSAFDLKGLKRINDVFGKLAGNAILKAFGEAAARAGGGDIAFAHLSGDEYAAKHDDRAKLAEFETRLRAELQKVGVSVMFGGAQFELTPDFRSGIGEKTYGRADQDLNARKRAEAAAPNDVQRVRGPDGAAPGDQGGAARGDGGRQAGLDGAQEVARLKQDTGATPKGYTELPAGRALQSTIKVFLNKSADVSTVVHEAGHAFLEQLFDLAERPDAPQRTKDTAAAALKALGVETRAEVKREHHEKFARSFEKYVFTGEAPSSGLKQVFARFTRWLSAIYRTLTGIPGAELSAELKPVFDAMLATEDQIAALRRKQGPQLTAEQLQVKAEERQAQLEQEADEYREGSHAAQLAAVKDALRAREAWWKKGLQQLEANFADEYEQLPARRAQRLISGEETGEAMVLDRKLVQEVIGELKVPGLKTAETGGVRPSLVAEMAGYASPRAMLAELAGLRSKETWVRAQAEATMRQLHPGILDDLTKFRALLSDGLRSATEKRLMREVQGLDREALKRAAEKLVERRVVGKLQPGRALAQQRAAAAAKARAMAKGDINATREAAQAELLNHYLHHELTAAAAEVGKVEDLAKRLGKTSARERLGKASPAYRDAVDFLRGALGFSDPIDLDAGTLEAAVAQLEGDAVTIGDPDWLAPLRAALSKTQDYRQLTVAELGAVRDALKMIETGARNRTEMLVDGRRADFEDVKAKALKEIASTLPDKGRIVAKNQRTATEKVKAKLSALDGFLLTPIDLVRDLTGDDQQSTLFKVVVNTMRRSAALEADLLEQRIKPVLDVFEKMSPEARKSLGDLVDGRALFPTWNSDLEAPRHVDELLSLALNFGSESSRKVVLEGFGITEDQVKAALDAHLKPEHIELINAVWKTLDALREPAFDLEERETGLRPKAVEAVPLQLKAGMLEGGYFPLKANPEASTVGARQFGEEQLASLFDPTFTRPGTAHGHLKSRKDGARYAVSLDLDVFRKHLLQVGHDLAYREGVKSVARLVMDGDIQRELTRKLGAEKTKEFLFWLKDIGGASGLQSTPADSLLSFFKKNLSTSALSGLSTAVGNFANLPAAVASTPLKAKHLAAGIAQVMAAPWDMVHGTSTARQAMLEKSGVMRSENSELVQQLQRDIVGLRAGAVRRGLEKMREVGMIAMRGVDAIVSTAVWTGAYRQALAEGRSEAEAVRWADDIHSKVQPSKNVAEKSRILRDKGTWVGAATIFYSYLNVAYRAQHRLAAPLFTQAFRGASVTKKATVAAAVAGNLLAFYVAVQVLGDLGMGRGPEDGDRDEEDPENKLLKWRNWLVRKVAVAPLSTIPVLPLTSIVEGGVLGKKVSPRAEPVTATLYQFSKLVEQLRRDEATEEDIAKAAWPLVGAFTGLPTRLVGTTGKYIWETTAGDREVPNAGRFVGGVIYGEKDGQPDNLPAVLGDGLDPLKVE